MRSYRNWGCASLGQIHMLSGKNTALAPLWGSLGQPKLTDLKAFFLE